MALPPLIDTHAHLDRFSRKGVLDDVLVRSREAGLVGVIAVGTEPGDWELYRELVPKTDGFVHFTVGLHPCSVEADWESAVDRIRGFFDGFPRPVALGETGLDRFHLPGKPEKAEEAFARQTAAFDRQLALAGELGVPVVVHSRGAFLECVERIDRSGLDWSRVVFHCFSEGPSEIADLVRRGGRGSFTGIVTYKSADAVRAAVAAQGPDRLMIETDAPYLAPSPHRGKENEPSWVRFTAQSCAATLGISTGEAAELSTHNARQFFEIKTK